MAEKKGTRKRKKAKRKKKDQKAKSGAAKAAQAKPTEWEAYQQEVLAHVHDRFRVAAKSVLQAYARHMAREAEEAAKASEPLGAQLSALPAEETPTADKYKITMQDPALIKKFTHMGSTHQRSASAR